MANTRSTTKQNDILDRVTQLGQDAISRLSEVPGGSRLVEMMNESKSRLDDMQKKLRGLDELEKRVAKLEKQVAAQGGSKAATTAKKPASSGTTAAAKKPATPKKPPA
jgi:hypothetical protein